MKNIIMEFKTSLDGPSSRVHTADKESVNYKAGQGNIPATTWPRTKGQSTERFGKRRSPT